MLAFESINQAKINTIHIHYAKNLWRLILWIQTQAKHQYSLNACIDYYCFLSIIYEVLIVISLCTDHSYDHRLDSGNTFIAMYNSWIWKENLSTFGFQILVKSWKCGNEHLRPDLMIVKNNLFCKYFVPIVEVMDSFYNPIIVTFF